MDNKNIAAVFEEIGDILDIQDAGFFRVNAYRKAALTISNYPHDLRNIVDKNPGELAKIPGIGTELKKKIIELVQSGKCEEHEKLKKSIPGGLLEILRLRGVGPKKVKLFFGQLGVKSIKELKEAAEKHRLRELEGMGPKSEEEILKAIEEHTKFSSDRFLLSEAKMEAERLISYMKKCAKIRKIQYAGSLRRRQETIGDLDILVTVKDPKKEGPDVMEHFVSYDEVIKVVANGDTKSSVFLQSGIDVDLRVVEEKSFGAALHYFTGSKEHNIRMRDIAKKRDLKLNEYGLFKGEKIVAGKNEEEIFEKLGLPYILPEMRKDDGEFEYLEEHKTLPKLIELKDIRGDLHNHSQYSDGKNTIEEMTKAFIAKGYQYFAMTDHSPLLGVGGRMTTADLKRQWKEIDDLNKKYKGKIRILKGSEVDILKDGGLDYKDEILKQLEVVVISAHMFQRLAEKEQTERIITALENPYVTILGHPSGRLINKRPPMEFDMEKVIKACIENDVALEINSNPQRLDLSDKFVRIAKEMGAKFSINTDSHSVTNPDYIEFGLGIARRGWLEKKNVINALELEKLTGHINKI